MNNVKNDERFFLKRDSRKHFYINLTEEEYIDEFNKSSNGINEFETNFNYDEEVKQKIINRLKLKLEYLEKSFINELKGQFTDNKLYKKMEFKELIKSIRIYDNILMNIEKEIGLKEFGLECLKKKNKIYTDEIKPMT